MRHTIRKNAGRVRRDSGRRETADGGGGIWRVRRRGGRCPRRTPGACATICVGPGRVPGLAWRVRRDERPPGNGRRGVQKRRARAPQGGALSEKNPRGVRLGHRTRARAERQRPPRYGRGAGIAACGTPYAKTQGACRQTRGQGETADGGGDTYRMCTDGAVSSHALGRGQAAGPTCSVPEAHASGNISRTAHHTQKTRPPVWANRVFAMMRIARELTFAELEALTCTGLTGLLTLFLA